MKMILSKAYSYNYQNSDIIYCLQNQSNYKHIGKTINQDTPTDVVRITASNNKTA